MTIARFFGGLALYTLGWMTAAMALAGAYLVEAVWTPGPRAETVRRLPIAGRVIDGNGETAFVFCDREGLYPVRVYVYQRGRSVAMAASPAVWRCP